MVLHLVWASDPGNLSAVRNGEVFFKTGKNMGDALQLKSIITDKVTELAPCIKFHECSFHKIKNKNIKILSHEAKKSTLT